MEDSAEDLEAATVVAEKAGGSDQAEEDLAEPPEAKDQKMEAADMPKCQSRISHTIPNRG